MPKFGIHTGHNPSPRQQLTPKRSIVLGAKATGSLAKDTAGTVRPKSKGQGAGPRMEGGSNEIGKAVPKRVLTTRVVRRATHADASLKPSQLVNHMRPHGAK